MKGTIGCLVKLTALVLIYFGLVHLGVVDYVKDNYFSPSREQVIEKSKSIADLSDVDEEYRLDKNLNIAGNKVVIAEHKATKQKFVVTKLKNNDTLTPEDFKTGKAKEKVTDFANKFQYKMVKLDNFKITDEGSMDIGGEEKPYLRFEADAVNLPMKKIDGIVSITQDENGENRIMISVNNDDKYSQIISNAFFEKLK